MPGEASRPARTGLSSRLLVLTLAFVILAEVLIYLPSLARFRMTYLEQKFEDAHLATRALLAAPTGVISTELEAELMRHIGIRGVRLDRANGQTLVLGEQVHDGIAASFDLKKTSLLAPIGDALRALPVTERRYILVRGRPVQERGAVLQMIINEQPMARAMRGFSWRILGLSLLVSLVAAGLVYLSLQWLMVRPMRRLTSSMTAFRAAPEDAARIVVPSNRRDEIGIAEHELAAMQHEVRMALVQKSRLAALGAAVSRINHDLRNMLATAQILSDRLAASVDPAMSRVVPRLVESLDRAMGICTRILAYGRADEKAPHRARFMLRSLVDEVVADTGIGVGERIAWGNDVASDLEVDADRDQLYRALTNLSRNAVQAIEKQGSVRFSARRDGARVTVEILDTGGGIPEAGLPHLFEPFHTGRPGGTGLGLAIARELIEAHGGRIGVRQTGPRGTAFWFEIPDRP